MWRMLVKVLKSQPKNVTSGKVWGHKTRFEIEDNSWGGKSINLPDEDMSFEFNKNGKFLGVWNYKQ